MVTGSAASGAGHKSGVSSSSTISSITLSGSSSTSTGLALGADFFGAGFAAGAARAAGVAGATRGLDLGARETELLATFVSGAEVSVSLWVADLGLAGRVGVGALFGCEPPRVWWRV